MVKFVFVVFAIKKCNSWYNLFVSFSISWHFSFQNQLWLGHLFFLPSFPRVKVWCPLSLSLSKYWTFLLWKSAICSSSNLRWSSTVFFSSETEIFISSNRACNWKSMTYIVYFKKRRYHNFGYYMVEIQNCDILA